MKRGQLTTFTIVALLILTVAVFISYIYPKGIKEELPATITLPQHIQPVYNLIDSCVSKAAKDAIMVTAAKGGYYSPPKTYSYPPLTLTYLYYKGQSYFPSLQQMQVSISRATQELAKDCIDFSQFPTLQITPQSELAAVATIQENKITIKTNYPLTIQKDTSTFQLSHPYTTALNTNLKQTHTSLTRIFNAIENGPSSVPLSVILDTGLDSEVTPTDESTYIYMISDKDNLVNDLPLTFMFAIGA